MQIICGKFEEMNMNRDKMTPILIKCHECKNLGSDRSDRSDRNNDELDLHPNTDTGTNQKQEHDYPPSCYYCNEVFNGIGKEAYEKHVLSRHPKMPCYPGLPDIEKHSLVAKGMWWEI